MASLQYNQNKKVLSEKVAENSTIILMAANWRGFSLADVISVKLSNISGMPKLHLIIFFTKGL